MHRFNCLVIGRVRRANPSRLMHREDNRTAANGRVRYTLSSQTETAASTGIWLNLAGVGAIANVPFTLLLARLARRLQIPA
jgi:hypothetical protein